MSQHENSKPVALTIAGLDPSGGAGVIADIRTFAALGCLSTAAITSLTFQNVDEVCGAEHLSPETLRAQVMPIIREHSVAAAKTGMLPTREIVTEVARLFRETTLPAPVVDPVMRATSGYPLIEEGALEKLLEVLMPLARVITPNIPEAERITGLRIADEEGMLRAARVIRRLGARAVLIKGGHLKSQEADGRRQEAGETLGPRPSRPLRSPRSPVAIDLALADEPRAGETPAVPVAEAIDVLDDEGSVTVFRLHAFRGHCSLARQGNEP
jgi:hydroxymethylpyrimidine kinase/phosphomethylpyrimidine kinase